MKKVILLLLIFSCQTTKKQHNRMDILGVYDGDTVRVDVIGVPDIFGKGLLIRLAGLDAPEIRTLDKCEKEKAILARGLLEYLINNSKLIEFNNCTRGKYFRLVCELLLNKVNVADILIEKKLAVKYFGGTKEKINWCNNEVKI